MIYVQPTNLHSNAPVRPHIVSYHWNPLPEFWELSIPEPNEIFNSVQQAIANTKAQTPANSAAPTESEPQRNTVLSTFVCIACNSRSREVCAANLCNKGAYR